MQTDLTFFTNEPGSTLLDRFRKTLKDVKFFDVLVGYFRTSGFYNLQKILANPDSPAVPQLEAEIDRLVYELYGLTGEEIALVERVKTV